MLDIDDVSQLIAWDKEVVRLIARFNCRMDPCVMFVVIIKKELGAL